MKPRQKILVLSTGGTFDKVYYDKLSDYQIGEPQIEWILQQVKLDLDISIKSILKKDSLDMTAADRDLIKQAVEQASENLILITHGTDTMPQTAQHLQNIPHKTIVLTGAMQPARFRDSDAIFNVGFALAALQLLAPGAYIAMNGRIFTADKVQKNRAVGLFEDAP